MQCMWMMTLTSFTLGSTSLQSNPLPEASNASTQSIPNVLQPSHLSVHGEYRPRYVHQEGQNFIDGGATNTVNHRARLGMEAQLQPWLGMRLTLQDIRVFGTELDTLWDYSGDGLDLSEGNLFFDLTTNLQIRLGRMPISFENNRIVGDSGFFQNTRTFDGARLVYDDNMLRFDLFFVKILEDTEPPSNDVDLIAANLHFNPTSFIDIAFIGVIDYELIVHQSGPRRRLWTAGALVSTEGFGFRYDVEAYWQKGRMNATERAEAALVATKLAYEVPVVLAPRVTLHGDWVSGDDDPTDSVRRVFDTPYASNHVFYGATDFFLDLPTDTLGEGLVDVGMMLNFHPAELWTKENKEELVVFLQARTFRSSNSIEERFGEELSIRTRWSPHPAFELDAMYAAFLRGPLFEGEDAHENFLYFSLHTRTDAILW